MKLNDCFTSFLTNAVEPEDADITAAKASHEEVRAFLEADEEYASRHLETFLAGSYRRSTAVKPIKDVDIIVVTNADYETEKPIDVLDELNRILTKKYKTKTFPQRRSIRIERDLMTLDVVPTVAPNGSSKPLKVPDREQEEWLWTHPKRHIDNAADLNAASRDGDTDRGRFVPTVKLVKKWKAVQSKDVRPKGFLLEVFVSEHHDRDQRDWADCFIAFLESFVGRHGDYREGDELPKWEDPGLAETGLPDRNLRTGLTSAEFAGFIRLAKDALLNSHAARDAATVDESIRLWRLVFGPEFTEPESTKTDASGGGPAIAVTKSSHRDIRESPPFA
jgi:hypothetical protein